MSREHLNQVFLKRHKRRVMNSINPFSAPISYSQRLLKAIQAPLKQDNPYEEEIETEKTHIILTRSPFDDSAQLSHRSSSRKRKTFKISKKRYHSKESIDPKIAQYTKIMSIAKKKRQLNQQQLQKMEIHKLLKREEMTRAVRRKKKKLESMRKSMSKQMMYDYHHHNQERNPFKDQTTNS